MKYKKSDLAKIFQDLGSMEKIEDIRVKAAEIQKDLELDYEEHDNVVSQNKQYETDIEDLRKANNKLFKMIGSPEDDPAKKKTQEDDEGDKPLKFEDLFDEKGELK